MSENSFRLCDVALPVPLDQAFTYKLPEALQSRISIGVRVAVPFAGRKLTGVVVGLHNELPDEQSIKDVIRILDDEPVLDDQLLRLGRWIAEYYCSPIGEVLKSMLPLTGEVRKQVRYVLTALGEDAIQQLVLDQTPATQALKLLRDRSRSPAYLAAKVPAVRQTLRVLLKRGLIAEEEYEEQKDPLRAASGRLRAEFVQRPSVDLKLKKGERELLAFLELHPGQHNLAELHKLMKGASAAARSLARQNLIRLEAESVAEVDGFARVAPVLNVHQDAALVAIEAAMQANAFRAFLLQGVTGSGKTEVYLRSIESALALGKSALLLVPEIALTPAMAGQFFHRFGKQVAILHSGISSTERADQWRRIRTGKARVVVGTRSGVFAPVQDLGLLIVDEEHDGSYKQGEVPRYHGRDVALVRAKELGAVAVLGSATPSIESRHNADTNRYTLLRLPERIAKRPMPQVEIVDMRVEFLETKRQGTFSRKLLEEIERRLEAGEQTMLLLNRRGFSSFMVCRACGEKLHCANCSLVLTHHKRDHRMLCHVCGYAEKIPTECPNCGSEYIQFLGIGSERVEDELHQHFPLAKIGRLDRDVVARKGAVEDVLDQFRHGLLDILVGTQMIAKGHDIPNVTLVGVVLADIGLSIPDFRAAERTFQLLTQAAGRAGRGETPGRVVIQTLSPEHYAVRMAAEQDYETFYGKETEFRRWLHYPPFAAVANILVRAVKQEDALRMVSQLGFELTPPPKGIRVMGPAEAPVVRLKNEFRYQILLKAASRSTLR
ncbi:MAG TPA: primosomal protein N', partial [Bryobacteraceae bacterium]|nr:primosomal protein N' [Bryobacteraceae bacterium]